jgi:hypothetical protein
MLKISDYLKHAEQCETLAKTARTPEEAESLRQMAAPWRKLAEAADRVSSSQREAERIGAERSAPSQRMSRSKRQVGIDCTARVTHRTG